MIKNLIATAAAAGLAFAPIAVQAGTRASDAGVSMSAFARAGADMGVAEYQGEEEGEGGGIPDALLIGGFAIVGLSFILAIESGENNKSPGT